MWSPHAHEENDEGAQTERHWQRVRLARLKGNPPISQEDLAGRLAAQGILIDRSAISRIESQSRYVMDYEAAAIARALRVSIAWLYERE